MCRDHEGTALGEEVGEEVRRLTMEVGRMAAVKGSVEERRRAVRAFRRGIERGEYAALFAGRVRAVVEQAAEAPGVEDEIGTLRVVMARLLAELEEDPVRVAHAISRVASVTVRAVKTQAGLTEAEPNDLELALQGVLKEIDAGRLPLIDVEDEDEWEQGDPDAGVKAAQAYAAARQIEMQKKLEGDGDAPGGAWRIALGEDGE